MKAQGWNWGEDQRNPWSKWNNAQTKKLDQQLEWGHWKIETEVQWSWEKIGKNRGRAYVRKE